jgi:hypothetical protein
MSENSEGSGRFEGNEGKEFARRHLVQVKVDAINWKSCIAIRRQANPGRSFFLNQRCTVAARFTAHNGLVAGSSLPGPPRYAWRSHT